MRGAQQPAELRAESSEDPRVALLLQNGRPAGDGDDRQGPTVRGRWPCLPGKSKVGAIIAAIGRSERPLEGLASRDGTG